MAMEDMMGMDPSMMGMDPSMMGMDPSMMGMDPSMMAGGSPVIPEGDPLAEAGQGGDTVMAHLTIGEVVIPAELVGQLVDQLVAVLGEEELLMRTVGHESNSINPETGYPEFSWVSSWTRKAIGWATGARAMENEMKEAAARARLKAKREAAQLRAWQEKENRRAEHRELTQSKLAKKRNLTKERKEDKLKRAREMGTDMEGNLQAVLNQRKGAGNLRSSQDERTSSTQSGYGTKWSNKKTAGLSLGLRRPA